MKNIIKLIGIIAIVAMIGLTMVSCGSGRCKTDECRTDPYEPTSCESGGCTWSPFPNCKCK